MTRWSIRHGGGVPLVAVLVVVALGGFLAAGPAAAQDAATGPREMRHFWHVFIAYGAAWLLLFGWVLSILRRLRRVEGKLGP